VAAKKKSMSGLKRVKNPLGKGTIRKGGLHKSTGTPMGQKIPAAKLAAAKAGKDGPLAKKQANMATNLAKIRKK
jgi:hypothetical protein